MAEDREREFKGGGGRRMAGRPRPKVENPGLLFKRIMSYVFKYYGLQMILVFVCKLRKLVYNIKELFADKLEAFRHYDDVGVVAYVA